MDPYNATLVKKEILAQGLAILRIAPDETPYEFEAGQYTVLGLLGSARRLSELKNRRPSRPSQKRFTRSRPAATSSSSLRRPRHHRIAHAPPPRPEGGIVSCRGGGRRTR
jgi:hypothetical protein